MPKRTNKTSHVLNLITNGASEFEDNQAPGAAAASQPPDAGILATGADSGDSPGTVRIMADNSAAQDHAAALRENADALRVSAAALRETVLLEAAETASLPVSPGEVPPRAEPEKEPVMRPAVPGVKKVIVNKSSDNDKISAEILNSLVSHLDEESSRLQVYNRINVMEEILRQIDFMKYMKNNNQCMCQRCQVDVIALTLTKLPAKYVVAEENTVAPLIGYYENKYKVRILTEIIKACHAVRESPRHGHAGTIQAIQL